MGKMVNVVLWDGTVTAVPEDDAKALASAGTARSETDQEEQHRALAGQNADITSGFAQGAKTVAEGALDTASGGLFGRAVSAADPEWGENMQARGQNRPGLHAAGSLLGAVLPGLSGVAAGAGGLAAEAVGSKMVGRAVEGAVFGAGAHIADTNISGDPLTIEGFVHAGGLGSMINMGAGMLADRFIGAGAKATGEVAAAKASAANEKMASEGEALFSGERGDLAYSDFRDAHNANQGAVRKANAKILSEAEDYAKATSPQGISKALSGAQRSVNGLRAEVQRSAYSKAMSAAEKKAAQVQDSFDGLVNSTEDYPKILNGFKDAIDKVADRYGAAGSEETLLAQLKGTKAAIDAGAELGDVSAQGAADVANQPASMAQEIQGYREQLSRASKFKAGGYNPDGSVRWNPSEVDPADVRQSLSELSDLRDKLKKFTHVKVPDLPEIPPLPEDVTQVATQDMAKVKETEALVAELDKAVQSAKQAARNDPASALNQLSAAGAKARQLRPDLPFPEIPLPPKAPIDFAEVDLPPTLRRFAAKRADSIADLSKAVAGNPDAAASFQKLADTLGFPTEGVAPGELVAQVHGKMGEYLKAIESLKSEAADAAQQPAQSVLRRWGKAAVSAGAGAYAYGIAGGGVFGAVAGALGRGAVQKLMGSSENALLGSALAASKVSTTTTVQRLVAKYAGRAGEGLQRAAPVMSYMGVSLSGATDHEPDVRKQTINRLNELAQLSVTANDSIYELVRHAMGHPADIAGKLAQTMGNALRYLMATAPKDPGLNSTLLKSNWTPSFSQVNEFSHRWEAVFHPMDAIARTLSGDGHPAGTEALTTVYPATMTVAQEEVAQTAHKLQTMALSRTSGFSQIFRSPISSLNRPEFVLAIQGQYLPPSPQPGGAPSRQPTGNPSGRPAAVQSPVAGSDPTALYS